MDPGSEDNLNSMDLTKLKVGDIIQIAKLGEPLCFYKIEDIITSWGREGYTGSWLEVTNNHEVTLWPNHSMLHYYFKEWLWWREVQSRNAITPTTDIVWDFWINQVTKVHSTI